MSDPTTSSITISARRRLRRTIDKHVADAHHPRPLLRGFRPLVRPAVALACEQSLTAMATRLADPFATVDASAAAELNRYLTDGATSSLFGHDAEAAAADATTLAGRLGHVTGRGIGSDQPGVVRAAVARS